MTTDEIQMEIARLSERVSELRMLQHGQRHLPFVTSHLEEHIKKLQQRISELRQRSQP